MTHCSKIIKSSFLILMYSLLLSNKSIADESNLMITDIAPTQFSVIWSTGEPATCMLKLFSDQEANNEITDQYTIISESHDNPPAEDNGVMKVTVKKTMPDTTYYFRTVTILKQNNENIISDEIYKVTTEIETEIVLNNIIAQEIRTTNNNNASGVLLLISVENGASPLSAWVGEGYPEGFSGIDLTNLFHSTTHRSYEISSGTTFQLMAYGGLSGYYMTIGQTIDENMPVQIIEPVAVLSTELINDSVLPISKAIIVASSSRDSYQGDPLWKSVKRSADMAYFSLMNQGYGEQNILYLSPETDSCFVDQKASLDNLFHSLNFWANDATKLILFMIGHGGDEYFIIQEKEVLNASVLDNYLDNLQFNSNNLDVLFIYDSCLSGSFISSMNPPDRKKRFIVTSCSNDGAAYFLNNGMISFSYAFWKNINYVDSLLAAYDRASDVIIDISNLNQTPQLNANGNNISNENEDYILADDFYIGNNQNYVSILSVSSYQTLSNTTHAIIWAKDIITQAKIISAKRNDATQNTISRVWAIISPPGFDDNFSDLHQIDLPVVEFEFNPVEERYEAIYNDFTIYGEYIIKIYASDIYGHVSNAYETIVYQKAAIDFYEDDDTFENAKSIIIGSQYPQHHNFHDTEDIDFFIFYGIKYEIYTFETFNLGEQCDTVITLYDSNQKIILFKNDFIAGRDEQVDWECTLDGIYYIKVNNFNPMFSGLNTDYRFRIYKPYAEMGVTIKGQIFDANSSEVPISDAIIKTDAGQSAISSIDGSYIIYDHPIVFSELTVTVEGYDTFSTVIDPPPAPPDPLLGYILNIDIPMIPNRRHDYAILVGASQYDEFSTDPLWKKVEKCITHAYRTLSYIGYDYDNIKLLTPELSDIENTMSSDNLKNTLYSCAVNAKNIILFMAGHGGDGYFVIKQKTILEASVLDEYLDDIQLNNPQLEKIILVYDSCFSGSFMPLLTPPEDKVRFVITSSANNERSLFLNQGGLSFSYQFWSHIFDGSDVLQSYNFGKNMMEMFQTPQLYADGNGISNEYDDKLLADNFFIGNTPQIPGIADHIPWFGLQSDDFSLEKNNSGNIWVSNFISNEPPEEVWALIIPPNSYSHRDSFERIELKDQANDGTFEGVYQRFTEPGTYTVICFATYDYIQNGYSKTIYSYPSYIYVTQSGNENAQLSDCTLKHAVLGLKTLSGVQSENSFCGNIDRIEMRHIVSLLKNLAINKSYTEVLEVE